LTGSTAVLKLEVNAAGVVSGVLVAEKALDSYQAKAQKAQGTNEGLGGSFGKVAAGIGLLGVAMSAYAIGKQALDTASSFQQLRVQLETVYGSAARAESVFGIIKKFAAETPFEVQNLTTAWTQLRLTGFEPTVRVMTSLGNVAAAMGKDITDIIGAARGAALGETERLKVFGIAAKIEGDQITLSLGDMSRTVSKDIGSVIGVLEELGNTKFAGGMDRQAKTYAGAASNLRDQLAALADEVGRGGLLDAMEDVTRELTEWISTNKELAASIGRDLGTAIKGAAAVVRFLADNWRILEGLLVGAAVLKASQGLIGLAGALRLIGPAAVAAGGPLAVVAAAAAGLALAVGTLIVDAIDDGSSAMTSYDAVLQTHFELLGHVKAATVDLAQAELDRAIANQTAARGEIADIQAQLARARADLERYRKPLSGSGGKVNIGSADDIAEAAAQVQFLENSLNILNHRSAESGRIVEELFGQFRELAASETAAAEEAKKLAAANAPLSKSEREALEARDAFAQLAAGFSPLAAAQKKYADGMAVVETYLRKFPGETKAAEAAVRELKDALDLVTGGEIGLPSRYFAGVQGETSVTPLPAPVALTPEQQKDAVASYEVVYSAIDELTEDQLDQMRADRQQYFADEERATEQAAQSIAGAFRAGLEGDWYGVLQNLLSAWVEMLTKMQAASEAARLSASVGGQGGTPTGQAVAGATAGASSNTAGLVSAAAQWIGIYYGVYSAISSWARDKRIAEMTGSSSISLRNGEADVTRLFDTWHNGLDRVSGALADGINAMVDQMGMTSRLEGLSDIRITQRSDKWIVAMRDAAGRWSEASFRSAQEALDSAIVTALASAQISGISPETQAVLDRAVGNGTGLPGSSNVASVEQLTSDLSFAQWVRDVGISDFGRQFRAEMEIFQDAMRRAFERGFPTESIVRLGDAYNRFLADNRAQLVATIEGLSGTGNEWTQVVVDHIQRVRDAIAATRDYDSALDEQTNANAARMVAIQAQIDALMRQLTDPIDTSKNLDNGLPDNHGPAPDYDPVRELAAQMDAALSAFIAAINAAAADQGTGAPGGPGDPGHPGRVNVEETLARIAALQAELDALAQVALDAAVDVNTATASMIHGTRDLFDQGLRQYLDIGKTQLEIASEQAARTFADLSGPDGAIQRLLDENLALAAGITDTTMRTEAENDARRIAAGQFAELAEAQRLWGEEAARQSEQLQGSTLLGILETIAQHTDDPAIALKISQLKWKLELLNLAAQLAILDRMAKKAAVVGVELGPDVTPVGKKGGGGGIGPPQQGPGQSDLEWVRALIAWLSSQGGNLGGGGRGGGAGRRESQADFREELARMGRPETTGPLGDSLRGVNDQFEEMRKRARDLKMGDDVLKQIDKLEEAAKLLLGKDVRAGLISDIRNNPVADQRGALIKKQQDMMAHAVELGLDPKLIRRWFHHMMGELIEEVRDANASFSDMTGLGDQFKAIADKAEELRKGIRGLGNGITDADAAAQVAAINAAERARMQALADQTLGGIFDFLGQHTTDQAEKEWALNEAARLKFEYERAMYLAQLDMLHELGYVADATFTRLQDGLLGLDVPTPGTTAPGETPADPMGEVAGNLTGFAGNEVAKRFAEISAEAVRLRAEALRLLRVTPELGAALDALNAAEHRLADSLAKSTALDVFSTLADMLPEGELKEQAIAQAKELQYQLAVAELALKIEGLKVAEAEWELAHNGQRLVSQEMLDLMDEMLGDVREAHDNPPAPPPPSVGTYTPPDTGNAEQVWADFLATVTELSSTALEGAEDAFQQLMATFRDLYETAAIYGQGAIDLVDEALGVQMARFWRDLTADIRAFYEAQTNGQSAAAPISQQQRIADAQAEFDRLAALAAGGDIEATSQLNGAWQNLLEQASQLGTSSAAYAQIYEAAYARIQALLASGVPVGLGDQAAQALQIDSTRMEAIMTTINQTLLDQLGALNRAVAGLRTDAAAPSYVGINRSGIAA
jgi:hypothetical protein